MVMVAVGQSDFSDIREVEALIKKLHERGIVIAGVDQRQVFSLEEIDVGRKIITEEKEGVLK